MIKGQRSQLDPLIAALQAGRTIVSLEDVRQEITSMFRIGAVIRITHGAQVPLLATGKIDYVGAARLAASVA